MGIAIEGIADYEYADIVRYFVPADGRLKYYIDRTGSRQGIAPTAAEISTVDVTLKYLDSITGVALEEVSDASGAQVTFFKAAPGYYGESNTIGRTETDNNGIAISWVEQDQQDWKEFTTIQHEIGHLFALKHPYGDGWNPLYDRNDTITSYNAEYYSTNSFSDSDKLALKAIWGEDRKTFVPGRGTHTGTVFADKFYLKDFDGYGEGSADVVSGFNTANGDLFQFASSAMGWGDAAKTKYRLLSIQDRVRTKKVKLANGKKKKIKTMSNDLNTVNRWDDANTAIYNTSTGEFFVDNNGSAYGLGNGGLVAVFVGVPSLSYDNLNWFSS
jgi:hypothetical protein